MTLPQTELGSCAVLTFPNAEDFGKLLNPQDFFPQMHTFMFDWQLNILVASSQFPS